MFKMWHLRKMDVKESWEPPTIVDIMVAVVIILIIAG